jgi:predicted transposase/invertase (TIGR01784 family)
LLHIEAQSRGGGDIAERMYFYMCLIYSHYRRELTAAAIIADKRPGNESRSYSHNLYGTKIAYVYNNLVLSELDDDKLLSSDNPIDIVLYAANYAVRCRKELQKFNYLRKATELLGERGWSMEEKRKLMLFMERVMNLKDESIKAQYRGYQEQLDREGKIVYVSIAEEYYTEKGIEKGKIEVARNLLARGDSLDTVSKIAGLPPEKIRELMN